ncbi:AIPR family protein [Streptomyces iconiensis]|uniref:AIPR family protein n=1 Tax=Streptomyces iconiensis TaxID=1384038 RepID=A0ABT6ZPL0_9ACTN|nr:AIPR family protein [Streptomyces iconiensis]MDJ1130797.1 AIPR family protein [Streptomyces iconiensis]
MSVNDRVLINQMIEERRNSRAVPLTFDAGFERFASEHALHGFGLSEEEVEAGVIGGANDGGIDSAYVFLGGRLLHEDSDIIQDPSAASKVDNGTQLTLWLVQAKTSPAFSETALDKVASTCKNLLDMEVDEAAVAVLYAADLLARFKLFRNALKRLLTRHPTVLIKFSYVTRGEAGEVHPKVQAKAKILETQFSNVFAISTGEVEFLGPAELWKRASTLPSYTLELPYRESITHGTSHIALVALGEYIDFLSEETGTIKSHIFDWNVRDYQGNVEVNREITASLQNPEAPEFWWLNNGITIVCSQATSVGKRLSLSDVQIVNGLQTSYTLHETLKELYLSDPADPVFERLVQVRILKTEDQAARDAVIRATNRQTSVPVASLRATDDIQRQIESYFFEHGWFYDRRKNFYRNQGKPTDRIVSIPLLAQSVMAIALGQPDNARARPSSLLKRNTDYDRIFSDKTQLSVYLWLAKAQRHVDEFLQSNGDPMSRSQYTNLHFHLAMLGAVDIVGHVFNKPEKLNNAAREEVFPSSGRLGSLWGSLQELFRAFQNEREWGPDRTAKSADFVAYLTDNLGYGTLRRK